MVEAVAKKLERVEELANRDEVYCLLMDELRDLEQQFDAMTEELPMEKRNLIWDFVMQCEDISARKLEVACRNMEFPD